MASNMCKIRIFVEFYRQTGGSQCAGLRMLNNVSLPGGLWHGGTRRQNGGKDSN